MEALGKKGGRTINGKFYRLWDTYDTKKEAQQVVNDMKYDREYLDDYVLVNARIIPLRYKTFIGETYAVYVRLKRR